MMFWSVRERFLQSSDKSCPFTINLNLLVYPLSVQFLNLSIGQEDVVANGNDGSQLEDQQQPYNFRAHCYVQILAKLFGQIKLTESTHDLKRLRLQFHPSEIDDQGDFNMSAADKE